jgi:hypothetical protein
MRDFREGESHSPRPGNALDAKAIETTDTEALELIVKALGYENWNNLPPSSKPPNRLQTRNARFRPGRGLILH